MPKYSTSNLHLVIQRPARRVLMVCLIVTALALAMAGGFLLGRNLSGLDTQYLQSLESIKQADELRLAQLNRDLIDARLAYTVDSQALTALRVNLDDAQTKMTKLQEEVTFYRSLMTPGAMAKGLQIAGFDTVPLASGGNSYHLLLTQIASRRSWLSGRVKIDVLGETESGPQVLPLTELASVPEYPLQFRFRYFQDLRGELRLPEGFDPKRVEVTVERAGQEPVKRSFPWSTDV